MGKEAFPNHPEEKRGWIDWGLDGARDAALNGLDMAWDAIDVRVQKVTDKIQRDADALQELIENPKCVPNEILQGYILAKKNVDAAKIENMEWVAQRLREESEDFVHDVHSYSQDALEYTGLHERDFKSMVTSVSDRLGNRGVIKVESDESGNERVLYSMPGLPDQMIERNGDVWQLNNELSYDSYYDAAQDAQMVLRALQDAKDTPPSDEDSPFYHYRDSGVLSSEYYGVSDTAHWAGNHALSALTYTLDPGGSAFYVQPDDMFIGFKNWLLAHHHPKYQDSETFVEHVTEQYRKMLEGDAEGSGPKTVADFRERANEKWQNHIEFEGDTEGRNFSAKVSLASGMEVNSVQVQDILVPALKDIDKKPKNVVIMDGGQEYKFTGETWENDSGNRFLVYNDTSIKLVDTSIEQADSTTPEPEVVPVDVGGAGDAEDAPEPAPEPAPEAGELNLNEQPLESKDDVARATGEKLEVNNVSELYTYIKEKAKLKNETKAMRRFKNKVRQQLGVWSLNDSMIQKVKLSEDGDGFTFKIDHKKTNNGNTLYYLGKDASNDSFAKAFKYGKISVRATVNNSVREEVDSEPVDEKYLDSSSPEPLMRRTVDSVTGGPNLGISGRGTAQFMIDNNLFLRGNALYKSDQTIRNIVGTKADELHNFGEGVDEIMLEYRADKKLYAIITKDGASYEIQIPMPH